ncbi:MAG: hypothetical protein Q9M89_03970 [Persephonella sp.]|nr:hypothetical protein [Persephonella sp.]
MKIDCDEDSILYLVKDYGVASATQGKRAVFTEI